MMSTVVTRQTLADQVADRIVEAIVVGDIAPGASISENDVALRFGVSRGPAREALFRLEGKGLVTRAAHHGARVVDLSLDDLRSLFELRESVEGMACRLAAERMSDGELESLDAALARHAAGLEAAAGQSYYQAAGDDDFHIAIAAASKSPRLLRALVEELYDVMRLYRFRSSSRPGRAREALAEHRAILSALRRRDPSAAEAAMRAHIRASWENTRANFQDAST